MARAETASASLRSDSIKGLAQSIANPAYRRLLTAEPVLRRAVPVLIVAFMLTICIGAAVQVLEHRRQVIFDSIRTSEALADHLATALDRTARDGRPTLPRTSEALTRALPAWAAGAGRSILIADVDGAIIASVPNDPSMAGTPYPRRARAHAAVAHRQHDRHDGKHVARRRRRVRHHAGAAQSDRLPRRRAAAQRGARELALDHGADRHALRHHRLRRPHPRLRLPLAGDAGARSGFDPRHRALSHRHRAQPRPLRAVGLGPGARPGVLVAFDVRHLGTAAEGRFAHLRRSQRAGAQGRHQSLRARHPSGRLQSPVDRPCVPHAPRRRPLAVAAGALRIGAPGGRKRPASDRHRRRHHRAKNPGRAHHGGGLAAARRHRDHPGSLRALGRRQSPGAVQFEFSGTASPA